MNDDDLLNEYGLLPRSNSPKKAVTQDDELLKEFGLGAPKQDFKEHWTQSNDNAWWKGLDADSSYAGIAKRFGIGALRGAKDVVDTAAHGLGNATAYVGDRILPEKYANSLRKSVEEMKAEDLAGRNEFNKEYPPSEGMLPTAAEAGRLTGQIAATAPLMPSGAMAGIATAAKALPTTLPSGARVAAPLANRLVAAAGQGALGGAALGGLTSSSNDESLAENVGKGALTGAIAGPALTGATSVGKSLASKLIGPISAERAALAKAASDHGIKLSTSQISTSPLFKKADQVSGWVPLSGANALSEKQTNQFTQAISKTFGENSTNITPELLQQAKQRIGADFEKVAKNTTIGADQRLAQNIANISSDAEVALNADQYKKFQKQVDLIIDKFAQNNGSMPGEAWQSFRHINGPMGKIINGADPDTGYYVKALKVAMDDAFNRSAPKDMQNLLKQANSQYKSMKTIEKLANNDPEGQVSPMRLMSKVINSPGGKLGAGKLGELADIGRAFFPKPADSGTPLGTAILDKLQQNGLRAGAGGAALAHAASGAWLPTALSTGAALAANRYGRAALNSKLVQNSMINSGLGGNYGSFNKLVERSVPYSSELISSDKSGSVKTYVNQSDIDQKSKSKLPVALKQR